MNNLYLSYKQLSGRWSYNRLFDNGNYGQGTVTFKKNNNNLIYSETGTLNLINGAVLKSKRKYIYRLSRNKLEIYFYETPEILFQTIELKKMEVCFLVNQLINVKKIITIQIIFLKLTQSLK